MSQTDDTTPYNTYSVDEETQLQPEDTLVDRNVDDVLDEGYTAPEKWSPGQGFGTTAEEEEHGESLDQRLIQEQPDLGLEEIEKADEDEDAQNSAGVEINADLEGEGELIDDEVGDDRSGRLVAPGAGIGPDTEAQLSANDVGIDSGAASAEEAAVHEVPEQA
jgi:hypothetical protein